MFPIEKGIPLPTGYNASGPRSGYPFRVMKVGDSFHVPAFNGNLRSTAKRVGVCASNAGRAINARFTVRAVSHGVRCWRVK